MRLRGPRDRERATMPPGGARGEEPDQGGREGADVKLANRAGTRGGRGLGSGGGGGGPDRLRGRGSRRSLGLERGPGGRGDQDKTERARERQAQVFPAGSQVVSQ